jgi:hypothetical protein
MRRPSKSLSPRLSSDSQRLTSLAQAIVLASSRVEERAWERSMDALLQKLLKNDHQNTIDATLDFLFKTESGAYDALMESVESASESAIIEHDGAQHDALLIALPILAWTRFSIPSGAIAADLLMTLSAHLYAHVLAPDTKLTLAPTLFSIDQLPRSHAETFAITHRMAHAALTGSNLRPPVNPPETAPFLADTRYLLAVVVAAQGAPLFRWQASQNPADRDEALTQWRTQATPTIARLLPGCGIELLLPEAYFVACREGDRQIRPTSIRAAVHYLTHTLSVAADELQANIGSFSEESSGGRVDEYRVGFTVSTNPDVVYGIVWPLYGQEDEDELRAPAADIAPPGSLAADTKTPLEEILALLRECGVTEVKCHSERFAMEFCDDCGAPYYPDRDAELVHAEMPEDVPAGPGHFH